MAKLIVSKGMYRASNFRMEVSDDLKEISAYSHGWWRFVWTDSEGRVVVNHTNYSPSTSKHQSKAVRLLERLGIQVALQLHHVWEHTESLPHAIELEVEGIQAVVRGLEQDIARKGSRRAKNKERREHIRQYTYRIRDLERYLTTGVMPAKVSIHDYLYSSSAAYSQLWILLSNRRYLRYFRKPSPGKSGRGTIQANEYRQFCKVVGYTWRKENIPESLDKLRTLLGLGQSDVQRLLVYQLIRDTEGMLPDQDSAEYIALGKALRRLSIPTDGSAITLDLDKLHTWLVDRQNRSSRVASPRTDKVFPVNPVLDAIERTGIPDFRLIRTDRQLRAEGRSQHHCIGGKDYIDRCYRHGYSAVHYRGYTFLLDRGLSIVQTNGKYNESTPYHITSELGDLITTYSKEMVA